MDADDTRFEEFKDLVRKVATGATLTREESARAFELMMAGRATPSQMGGLLMAMRMRGETVEEITGGVIAMRARMRGVVAPPGAMDLLGTGGDSSGSYNISTCAALIVAGAGVPVAKQGNRALSSRSGAADVLRALGVRIDCGPRTWRAASPRRASASCSPPTTTRRRATSTPPASSSARAPSST